MVYVETRRDKHTHTHTHTHNTMRIRDDRVLVRMATGTNKMMMMTSGGVYRSLSVILLLLLFLGAEKTVLAFSVVPTRTLTNHALASYDVRLLRSRQSSPPFRVVVTSEQSSFALFMGRAAAVRANTKAKTDMKKAKTNASYGKKIIMAVKQGGSADPNANRQLADIMKQAKANSVPVENIQRAIKKASEDSTGGDNDFKERTFEAYGHGGASIIISVLTDNDNRANSDVRSTVNRRNGKMAEQGSVLFLYDRKGVLDINTVLDEETVLEAAIGAGIDDYELQVPGDEDGTSKILTDPKEVSTMLDAIKASIVLDETIVDNIKMSLAYVSKAPVEVSDEDFEKNMNIIDALDELDDVDSVEHNMSN